MLPNTTGFAPGIETSWDGTPRFSIIFRMSSALRWMFARSEAMLGMESSVTNSSTIARSCCCRHWRAAWAAGFVGAALCAGNSEFDDWIFAADYVLTTLLTEL